MRWLGGIALAALAVSTGRAHYNMLLPDTPSAKKGQPVTLTYQWGHPFEHQLFDAPEPDRLLVIGPDGKSADLTRKLEKVALPGDKGKKVTAYRLRFTPAQRGDYVFLLRTPPIWLEEDEAFVRDTVKVVLHVQAQKGWDAAAGPDFELTPLTRPYGLEPGMVVQVQLAARPSYLAWGVPVEVERYNAAPPKEMPPDEQITRVVKTDGKGVVTTTLTDPGWWCLTATREAGKRTREGEEYPVRQRCTFWVFVAEKFRGK
jgi:cobalt/nickel transport protein